MNLRPSGYEQLGVTGSHPVPNRVLYQAFSGCEVPFRIFGFRLVLRILASGRHQGDLVFAREDGTRFHPDLFSQEFQRLIAGTGLPRIRLHDLRVRHEALCYLAGWKDQPWGCRSSPLKLRAA